MPDQNLEEIRAELSRRKQIDKIFAIVGFLVIAFSIFVLLGLTLQMAITGIPQFRPISF